MTERNADEAEREVDDYKKAVYMSKFLGEKFTGTISGVQEFGIFVELETVPKRHGKTAQRLPDGFPFTKGEIHNVRLLR